MQKKYQITATSFGIDISSNMISIQPDRGTCLQGQPLVFGGLSMAGTVWELSLYLSALKTDKVK